MKTSFVLFSSLAAAANVPYLNESVLVEPMKNWVGIQEDPVPLISVPVSSEGGPRGRTYDDTTYDEKIFKRALEEVGKQLVKDGVMVNMVVTGGAINVMYLHSRGDTYDIDFFLGRRDDPVHHNLNRSAIATRDYDRATGAITSAETPAEKRLHTDWLNNDVASMLPSNIVGELADISMQQNVVLFDHVRPDPRDGSKEVGLRVYAALWAFNLCQKLLAINPLSRREKPYEMDDAVSYANEYLKSKNMQSIHDANDLHDMCAHVVIPSLIEQLNEKFQQTYNRPLFDIMPPSSAGNQIQEGQEEQTPLEKTETPATSQSSQQDTPAAPAAPNPRPGSMDLPTGGRLSRPDRLGMPLDFSKPKNKGQDSDF